MLKKRILLFTGAVLFVVSFTATKSTAQTGASNISFTVSMPQPWTHLLEVEMKVTKPAGAASTLLTMPVWTPGSYLVREFERHVQGFSAQSAGRPLEWTKINK